MRPRDPRRRLDRRRRARARVKIVHVPRSGYAEDGSIGSKQSAEVTLPRPELERIWSAEYLERLARTYWSFLTRFSLGILRVLYSEDAREVVVFRRPFVLLRFHKPEYHLEQDGGTVTWPIDEGTARRARGQRRARLPAPVGITHRRRERPRGRGLADHLLGGGQLLSVHRRLGLVRQGRPPDLQPDAAADPRDRHPRVPALAGQPRARAVPRGSAQPSFSPVISRSFARS